MKVSIIVPVFNVCQYLRACIESIISQDYKDIEIIIVDDGSNDGSSVICDSYSSSYDFITVIHTENKGVSNARNTGIDASSGEWILFVDSDDCIESKLLGNVVTAINKRIDEVDVVIFGTKRINRNEGSLLWQIHFEDGLMQVGKDYSVDLFDKVLRYGTVCGKLYKKSVLDMFGIRFDTGISLHEDHLFYFDYLSHVSNIALTTETGYLYLTDDMGVSLSTKKQHDYKQKLYAYTNMVQRFVQIVAKWKCSSIILTRTGTFLMRTLIDAIKAANYSGDYKAAHDMVSRMINDGSYIRYMSKTWKGKIFSYIIKTRNIKLISYILK